MTIAYIYVLIDPRDNKIKYVGKTNNPQKRLNRHITEIGETRRHIWLKGLHENGLKPIMEIVDQFDNSVWKEKEKYWIGYYRSLSYELYNTADGGNGARGDSPSAVTRQRLSASMKEFWKKYPRKLSEKHKSVFTRKNAIVSQETKDKISRALLGKKKSKEAIENIRKAKLGGKHKPHSVETKKKLRNQKLGERNPMAKLNYEIADEIRRRYAIGNVSLTKLSLEYHVDAKQIHRIVRNETWVKQ